jgi:hypothetical protein
VTSFTDEPDRRFELVVSGKHRKNRYVYKIQPQAVSLAEKSPSIAMA